jgi:hypothetical protein
MWVTPLVTSLEYSRSDKRTLVQLLSDDQPVVAGVFAHPGTFGNGLSTTNPNNAVSFGDIFVTKVRGRSRPRALTPHPITILVTKHAPTCLLGCHLCST